MSGLIVLIRGRKDKNWWIVKCIQRDSRKQVRGTPSPNLASFCYAWCSIHAYSDIRVCRNLRLTIFYTHPADLSPLCFFWKSLLKIKLPRLIFSLISHIIAFFFFFFLGPNWLPIFKLLCLQMSGSLEARCGL